MFKVSEKVVASIPKCFTKEIDEIGTWTTLFEVPQKVVAPCRSDDVNFSLKNKNVI